MEELKLKTRAANKIQTKLVTLLYGATFSGKTTLGLQLADFKRNDGKPYNKVKIGRASCRERV